MTANKDDAEHSKSRGKTSVKKGLGHGESQDTRADQGREPDWANGLRQLYDSVVDEPLPDSFKDLLSQLDEKSS